MEQLHRFVVELAVFEKEPNAVQLSPKDYLEHFTSTPPKFDFVVAVAEQGILGIALFYEAYSTWRGPYIHLEDLIINENYRGHGIGKALFLEVAEIAKNQGSRKLTWEVLDWNKSAIEFYKHLGAEITTEWWGGTLYFSQS